MATKQPINWLNTLFISLTTIIGVVGVVLLASHGLVAWQTWVLTGVMAACSSLSITGGYHRLFAHKTYKAAFPVRLFFALFGAATFQGSIIEWSTDHRNHHRYTDDVVKDPYSIKKGFWWAHVGWLLRLDTSKRDFSNVKDLMADPLCHFQHRFFVPIALFMGFVLPTAIAALWGNVWIGLIVACMFRITFTYQTTFFINSLCHYMGKKTYSDLTARDNGITALFTFGEGYHNFHHKFPGDYRNGVRAHQYDPTKWLIYGLSKLGLASDLKRVPSHLILHNQLTTQSSRLQSSIALLGESKKQAIAALQENIQQLFHKIETLEQAYAGLKREKLKEAHGKFAEYRARLDENREKCRKAFSEFRLQIALWQREVKPALALANKV